MSAICLMPRQSRGRTANHHDATWMRLLWSEGPGGWYAPCPAASGVTSAAASAPAPPAVTATVSPQVLGGTRGPQVRTRWHTERLTGSALQGLGGTRGTQVRTRWHTQPVLTPHRRGTGAGPGPGARTVSTARPGGRGPRPPHGPSVSSMANPLYGIPMPLTCGLTCNELVFDNRRGGERACGNRVDADGAAWAVRGSRDSWARHLELGTCRPRYLRSGRVRSECSRPACPRSGGLRFGRL
jgi:hypothetical protein